MSCIDEELHAMDADNGDEEDAAGSKDESRVLDGHGKGEDTDADVALDQVDDRGQVAEKKIYALNWALE